MGHAGAIISGLLHGLDQHSAELRGAPAHRHVGSLQRLDLGLRRALPSGNDGAGVAHPAARGSGDAGDKGNHRLGVGACVVLLKEISGCFLSGTTDLANHDYSLGVGIPNKDVETVDKVCSVERVSADPHAERLSQANLSSLVNSLVGESTGSGDDTNTTFLVNVTRHYTNLARVRGDDTGTVGSDQPGLALPGESVLHLDHVLLGNTLGDADDQRYFGLQCFYYGGSGPWWWP